MALTAGTRLGVYDIIAPLGAGGMGEVYRARDTRLGREVAIKVVIAAFVADRERAARFEREARTLAALNHPNVATLYGMEEADGQHFLVMELVEGATLAEILPLPLERALGVARQIAEALEAAHEKGIVHRDLKPANVKVTPDETVKVLDFGLAKAADPDRPSAMSLANSPTISAMSTQAGVILGTASYMSPEQAKGFAADHRSDIFSFGVVLYEMLTGRQAFQGETVSDVLASVLAREPDFGALPPDLAPRLAELVKRCLEKHPKRRWQAIGDVRHELESIAASPRATPAAPLVAAPPRPRWRRALPAAVAAVGAAAVTAAAFLMTRPVASTAVVSRFVIPFAEGQERTVITRPALAISPDGTLVAYVANRQIYLRTIGSLDARPIPGTSHEGSANAAANPASPVFSPDGRSIAYWQQGDRTIKRVEVMGGAPVTICTEDNNPVGLTWSGDTLLYARDGAIVRVPATGGQPEPVIELTQGELATRPQLLPDGRSLLFAISPAPALNRWIGAKIVVQKPGESARTTLVDGGSDVRYLPSGHLVYAASGSLFARRFDPSTGVVGRAVSVVEGVLRGNGNAAAPGISQFAVSDTGTLVYFPGPIGANATNLLALGLFDRSGKADLLSVPPGPYSEPRMSPDGRRVAFGSDDGQEVSIWVYELSGGASARRLTFGGRNRFPVWMADSQRVVFQSDREGNLGLFVQRGDGTGTAERLTKPEKDVAHVAQSASPDGASLLVDQRAGQTTSLLLLTLKDRTLAPFGDVTSSLQSTSAVFSPNGRWVAYSTREAVRPGSAVFVQPFPPTGAKFQLSPNNEDGHHPMWAPDGKELFYTPGSGTRLTGLTVTTTAGFQFGQAPPVGRPFTNASPAFERTFDVTRDGKRFLGLIPPGATTSQTGRNEIRVVLNWHQELKQRVPDR